MFVILLHIFFMGLNSMAGEYTFLVMLPYTFIFPFVVFIIFKISSTDKKNCIEFQKNVENPFKYENIYDFSKNVEIKLIKEEFKEPEKAKEIKEDEEESYYSSESETDSDDVELNNRYKKRDFKKMLIDKLEKEFAEEPSLFQKILEPY